MIGKACTGCVEIIVAFLQGGEEVGEVGDGDAGSLLQLFQPWVEMIGAIYLEGLIRAEGGDDFGWEAGCYDGFVVL